jgi:hypothetical protein
MDLSWWRDLVIVVWGLVGALAIIFICVIILLLYRRMVPLLHSAGEAVDKVSDIVSYTDQEVIQPMVKFGAAVQGVVQGISYFTGLFKSKEDSDE